VVEQYFAAINAGNYTLAWSLGGMNIGQGSYDSFAQGFAGTSSDSVTIVSVSGDTATVRIDATQTDGTHKYFAGTYTVRDGVIVAADIQ
jgi:eukaryotic-like serine/threonine-protein kinase